jgi:hypothetical protein
MRCYCFDLGADIPKSLHILIPSGVDISLCRGTVDVLPVSGLWNTLWLPPSRMNTPPHFLMCLMRLSRFIFGYFILR